MKNQIFKTLFLFLLIAFYIPIYKTVSIKEKKKKYLDISYSISQDTIKFKVSNIYDSTLHYFILLDGKNDTADHRVLYDIRNVKSFMMNYQVNYDSIKINKNEIQYINFVISNIEKVLGKQFVKRHKKFCLYYRIVNNRFLHYYSEDIVYFKLLYKEKMSIELLNNY